MFTRSIRLRVEFDSTLFRFYPTAIRRRTAAEHVHLMGTDRSHDLLFVLHHGVHSLSYGSIFPSLWPIYASVHTVRF